MNKTPSATSLSPEMARIIYRKAYLINRTDERFRAMLTNGELAVAYYPVRGHEVIAAAAMAALEPDDYLVTTYRGLHDSLAKGIPSRLLWAEFAGKRTGTCKGKGGPMHITHPETGVMVTTGIVGSGIPIANGLAMSSQIRGENRVAVASFGTGPAISVHFMKRSTWRRCGNCLSSSSARTTNMPSIRRSRRAHRCPALPNGRRGTACRACHAMVSIQPVSMKR